MEERPASQDDEPAATNAPADDWTPRVRRAELGLVDYLWTSGIVVIGVLATYFGFTDTLVQLLVAGLKRLG